MSYAELHCLSHYSFLRGASHPADLIKTAKSLGYQALAITDECSLAGVVKAHAAAQESNLHLILGSEFKLDEHRLISLVTNQQSYSELSSLITLARRRSEKGEYQIKWSDIQHNLHNSLVIWLPSKHPRNDHQIATKLIKWFSGRLWIGVEHLLSGAESADYRYLYNLATLWEIPMVASGDVHMHCKQRRALQDT
jgi:error-prone DNA polymerase